MQPNKTLAGWILLQDDLVEEFVDAIGLRVAHFGLGMLDVIQGQMQLVAMRFRLAAIRRTSIRQNSDQTHPLLGKERHTPCH